MNLLLLEQENLLSPNIAKVSGRQLTHINEVLKLSVNDSLTVGLENGSIGRATLTALDKHEASLTISWDKEAPSALPITLIIAMPRPKMLKRIIQTATTMGVKQLYFLNAWKVEKSYWQSPWLNEDKIRENCIIGLEQAKDTVMPEVHIRKRFKPFVEDELPSLSKGSQKLLAHPGTDTPCPINITGNTTLIIGPEGGFTPYEVEKLRDAEFEAVHLGERILRVETAVPALLARLFCP
jgi:16S rRNA (uracil1498-N3)-methyltransferase